MAEPLESLTVKVVVMKVSIHCKGCMKKVYKIIRNTQGVLEINIEPLLNKVTVKTTCDANDIIARLAKYGKHAELWPQPKPSPAKIDNNNKSENITEKKSSENSQPIQQPSENSEMKSATTEANAEKLPGDIKKETAAQISPTEPPKKAENEAGEKDVNKVASKPDDKKTVPPSAQPEKPEETATDIATEKTVNKAPATDRGIENIEKNNSISDKKSKGKEQQGDTSERAVPNHSNIEKNNSISDKKSKGKEPQWETSEGAIPNHSNAQTVDNIMAMNNIYPYQQPSYVMSYNMSQPTASLSYYAYPMQREPQGYMYQQFQPPSQEYYYGSMERNSLPEMRNQYRSYDEMNMFNEEDPNSCSVM